MESPESTRRIVTALSSWQQDCSCKNIDLSETIRTGKWRQNDGSEFRFRKFVTVWRFRICLSKSRNVWKIARDKINWILKARMHRIHAISEFLRAAFPRWLFLPRAKKRLVPRMRHLGQSWIETVEPGQRPGIQRVFWINIQRHERDWQINANIAAMFLKWSYRIRIALITVANSFGRICVRSCSISDPQIESRACVLTLVFLPIGTTRVLRRGFGRFVTASVRLSRISL